MDIYLNIDGVLYLLYSTFFGLLHSISTYLGLNNIDSSSGGWGAFLHRFEGFAWLTLFLALLFLFVAFLIKFFWIAPLEEKEAILFDTVYPKDINTVGKDPKDARWKKILDDIASDEESRWKVAILDADTILDELLGRQGFSGQSVGEKLIDAQRHQGFETLDAAWEAHKTRNRIAHKTAGFFLSKREAKKTVSLYGEVFREFYILQN